MEAFALVIKLQNSYRIKAFLSKVLMKRQSIKSALKNVDEMR